jgi:hypothetical protein
MWIAAYQTIRVLKWLLRLGFLGLSLHYVLNRAPYIDQFGQLTLTADVIMFGLPLAAMAAGLLELMLRDRVYPRALP